MNRAVKVQQEESVASHRAREHLVHGRYIAANKFSDGSRDFGNLVNADIRHFQINSAICQIRKRRCGPRERDVNQFRCRVALRFRQLHGGAPCNAPATAEISKLEDTGFITNPAAPPAVAMSRVELCTSAVTITTTACESNSRNLFKTSIPS